MDLSENNKQAMDVIDTAAFCLCFDDTAPTDEIELCRAFLYGDGANRCQIIISFCFFNF